MAHGWYLLPTSLLLKAALPTWTGFQGILFSLGGRALALLGQRTQITGLLVLALALRLVEAVSAGRPGNRTAEWFAPTTWIFAGTAFLHYQFAGIGWFYRYEAYLAAMGIATIAVWVAERGAASAAEPATGLRGRITRGWPGVALLIMAAYPLGVQGLHSYAEIEIATRNIREQHLQTARFIRRYYPDSAVALNDIGMTSFLTDAKVLDLAGLGDIDVARARLKQDLSRDTVQRLATKHGVRIAILYQHWFAQALPLDWAEVGRLTIRDCVVGEPTVTLFAVSPDERGPLLQHLLEFVPSLPSGVRVQLARN
jgi:hypothetical protein